MKAGGWMSQPGKKGLASTWQGVAEEVKAEGWTSQPGKKGLASTWQGEECGGLDESTR